MGEWKEYRLDEISSYINRGVSPLYVEGNGVPIINQKCVRNGKLDLNQVKYTTKTRKYNDEKKMVYGDILINSTGVGTAGRVAQFTSKEVCYVDTHVSILRINKNFADSRYVFYNLFKREDEIESYAEG